MDTEPLIGVITLVVGLPDDLLPSIYFLGKQDEVSVRQRTTDKCKHQDLNRTTTLMR